MPTDTTSRVIIPELHISIPKWPDNLGFWSGVKTEALIWKTSKEEEGILIPLEDWHHSNIDLSTGGTLCYEGRAEAGTLLLYGELEIEPWRQKDTIPQSFILEIYRVDFE